MKTQKFMLALLCATILCTSCISNPPQTESLTQKMLQGTWQLTSSFGTGGFCGTMDIREPSNIYWTFIGDSLDGTDLYYTFHYVVNKEPYGMILRFDADDKHYSPMRVISLTNKELILTTDINPESSRNDFTYYVTSKFQRIESNMQTPTLGDKSLIKGEWKVVSGTRTYCPGAGTEVEELNIENRLIFSKQWLFEEHDGKDMVNYTPRRWNNNSYKAEDTEDSLWTEYTIIDGEGCYILTINDLFDYIPDYTGEPLWMSNHNASPIRVKHLTKNKMEWEFEYGYGNDEGPDTYYLYLEK